MRSKVYGLQACSICPRTRQVAEVAITIATAMRAEGATDIEIIDAVEAEGLAICGHCPQPDDIEAKIDDDDVVTVNLAPRGPMPAYYAH